MEKEIRDKLNFKVLKRLETLIEDLYDEEYECDLYIREEVEDISGVLRGIILEE